MAEIKKQYLWKDSHELAQVPVKNNKFYIMNVAILISCLFKKGDNITIENYRPIYVLNICHATNFLDNKAENYQLNPTEYG